MSEKQALLAGWAGRVSAMRGWRQRGLAFLLGALAGLAFAPFYLFPLLVVGLTGLLWMIDRRRPGLASFSAGWWWGFGHFIVCFYWISEALMVDAARFAWMTPFIIGGLAGVTALFIGLAAVVTRWLDYPGAAKVIAFAAAWMMGEWLRGHIFSGFPWDLAGYTVAFSDALNQYAALGGSWGLSLLVVAIAAMPSILGTGGRREGAIGVGAAVLAALALYVGGAARLAGDDKAMVPGTILRLVQPNIPETLKWVQGLAEQHVMLTQALTTKVPGVENIRAAIWPETAVPFLVERDKKLRMWLGAAVPEDALLITGALRGEPLTGDLDRIYNSLIALDHGGDLLASADKYHLVPLGEYVPARKFIRFIPFISKITPGDIDFTPGPGPRTLHLPGLPPVGVIICYEAIFPGGVVEQGDRPQWLLNITNDAWFGTSTGPYQHFVSARLRSVEEGLPLVRVANTGISGLVDRYGQVLTEIPLAQSGVRDVPLPAALGEPPLYARFGDWLVLAQLLIAIALARLIAWRQSRI